MPLHAPNGPYAVSTLTLELPVRKPTIFTPHFTLHGEPVLQLRTLLVTLYYPSASARSPKAPSGDLWLNGPRLRSVEGLLKYAGFSKHLAIPAVLPAYNVFLARLPLLQSAPIVEEGDERRPQKLGKRLPVAVFSHGLGGTRNTYSQYLSALASNGVVIASVEHRDLSGPSTTVCTSSADSAWSSSTHVYHRHGDLDSSAPPENSDDRPETGASPDTTADEWAWRRSQLLLRQAEVREAAWMVEQLNTNPEAPKRFAESSTRCADGSPSMPETKNVQKTQRILQGFSGRLDSDNLWALGHSFGGATMLETLRARSRLKSAVAPSPAFSAAILLDPWLDPFTRGTDGPAPPVVQREAEEGGTLFVLNSEVFTVWQAHFRDLRKLVLKSRQASGDGWLLTTTGTKHTDFSDFPFLLARMFASKLPDPTRGIDIFAQASLGEIFRKGSQGSEDADATAIDGANGNGAADSDAKTDTSSPLSPPDLDHVRSALPDLQVRPEKAGEVEEGRLGDTPGVLVVHPLEGAPEDSVGVGKL